MKNFVDETAEEILEEEEKQQLRDFCRGINNPLEEENELREYGEMVFIQQKEEEDRLNDLLGFLQDNEGWDWAYYANF